MIGFLSCEKNPVKQNGELTIGAAYRGAIIVNEGHFQQGDASLSFFDSDSQQIYNDVFKDKNGESLGDVGNSIYLRDTLAYIVINNSDKIEVINTQSFRRSRKIILPAGTSPRHLAFTDDAEILVTSLYSGKVLSIDLASGVVSGEIPVGANPEEILRFNNQVFVANSGFGAGNTVSVIGLPGKAVQKEIDVGDNPRFLRADPSGRIHVLCGGDYKDWGNPDDDTPGGIWVIDPGNMRVSDSLILPVGQHPGKFDISAEGHGYVVVDGQIRVYETQTMELLENDITGNSALNAYALRFNSHENLLYILDAVDFVSMGRLWILDPENSAMTGPFETGAIPGDVAFIIEKRDQ